MAIVRSIFPNALRVAVLAGGPSAERPISLQSGDNVRRALSERGHFASIIDPRETELKHVEWNQFDVAFLALHGTFGEDGQVQELLDGLGVPYTGSHAEASRLAFSKSAAKERFAQCGVPTPSYVLIHQADDAARIQKQATKLGFPLAVKPDKQGSSLGVGIVASSEELPRALTNCFHYDQFGVLERAIIGREWTVALLDDTPLPAIQIQPKRQFFDFYAKYEDDATGYEFETDLPAQVVESVSKMGTAACAALGTRGLARVDIMLDKLMQPWVLEVNTIPGFTDHSLVPKAATHAGIPFGELCERTIQTCLRRRRIAA